MTSQIVRIKMSPERSNSPQDEAVSTPKMSVPASPIAGTPIREAQSPISLLLAVAQSQSRNGDDDLTSLSWLHERDLLKGMNINPSPSNSVNSTPVKYSNSVVTDQFASSGDYTDDNSISAADSSNSSLNSPVSCHQPNGTQQRNKHPHHIPYDPLVHTNNKPPFSFSCLIFMAIEESVQKALPVKEIYAWIVDHFPYFKNAPTGWKNSVRHNLSLNKCFQKVEKAPNLGKGSLWTVEDQYKPNLINALTKSPFQPTPGLDPSIYLNNNNNNKTQQPERHAVGRLPNPELYPYLSKKLSAEMNRVTVKAEASDESLDAADAAAVMLSLKHGPRYRQKKDKNAARQIITTSPSQDHTYSAAEAVDSADADSDDERIINPKTRTCRKIDFEDEEERKIKEGAETLLNLAGISTRKRHNSNHTVDHQDLCKRFKPTPATSPQYDINENESNFKPAPFKPRLLRNKRKDANKLAVSNNINNNNNDDEWVKHRRQLEINQQR